MEGAWRGGSEEYDDQVYSDLLEKGEHLDRELEGMIAEGRNSNPIVNHLLFNAASSMGYKIGGNDEVVVGKTSGEVLADYESS